MGGGSLVVLLRVPPVPDAVLANSVEESFPPANVPAKFTRPLTSSGPPAYNSRTPSTAVTPPPTLYLIPSFSFAGGGTPPNHATLAKLMDKIAENTQNGHDSFSTTNNNVMRNTEKTPMVVHTVVNQSRLASSPLLIDDDDDGGDDNWNTKGPSARMATPV